MLKVLVADSDMDSHELVHDILHINFRDVHIERALSVGSFFTKIRDAQPQYDLILLSTSLEKECEGGVLSDIRAANPELLEKIVIMSENSESLDPLNRDLPHISKPFSLDYFGEVIKRTCAC